MSSPQTFPPTYQQHPPANKANRGCLTGCAIIGGICALVLIGFIAIILLAPTPPPEPTPELVSINPKVEATMNTLIITNRDKFAYDRADVVLNPSGMFQGGHSLTIGAIQPGKTVRYSLLEFTDSDGKRFNPYDVKLTEVRMFVKVGDKDAVSMLKF